jgi:predicted regulator of Ras-like GTPase activity (Roadblock/LC7/MglB family)
MEIANYIKEKAQEMLEQGTMVQLPAQIADGQIYLASAEDESILAHGTIKGADGTEYKLGTKK